MREALGVRKVQTLLPHEECLVGSWIETATGVKGDDACKRIHWLAESQLDFIQNGSWESLYLDPIDGRHWLLFYPQSEMHGGGPPSMRVISKDEIIKRFNT